MILLSAEQYSKLYWAGLDLNQRRLTPTGLQPVPFSLSGTDPGNTASQSHTKTLTKLNLNLQLSRDYCKKIEFLFQFVCLCANLA